MLRLVAEYFGDAHRFGPWFGHALGWVVGILFFLLLLSAANTAMVAMIGVFYMMARDGEMPRQFSKLNRHGVPIDAARSSPWSCRWSCSSRTPDFDVLAGLYAIGVVGAIAVNLGSLHVQ